LSPPRPEYYYQRLMASGSAAANHGDHGTGACRPENAGSRGEFMNKLTAIAATTATLAVVMLNAGTAAADGGGSSGVWPAHLPLPTDPGTVVSQSSTTAVVRSTDSAAVVTAKLDDLYVTQKGCTRHLAVNRPRDYLCFNAATGKTDEVVFTFASLDPTATDPSRTQTNAFLIEG
jgi:hypothetical protein